MKGFASACRALLCCLFRVILARHAVGAMTCLQPSLMGESHLHLKIETNSMYDAFSARGPQPAGGARRGDGLLIVNSTETPDR